jgi:hypothetical protein
MQTDTWFGFDVMLRLLFLNPFWLHLSPSAKPSAMEYYHAAEDENKQKKQGCRDLDADTLKFHIRV